MIAGEDDDGLFGQFQFIEQGQHASDIAIDALDGCQVLSSPFLDLGHIDVVVDGFGDFGVEILEGGPVFGANREPGGVRGSEVEREGEGVLRRVLSADEVECVVSEHIAGVAVDGFLCPVEHFQAGSLGRAASGADPHEFVVTELGGVMAVLGAQVPFSAQGGPVAGVGQ